jgi:precorrin-8X/cobalt-precorrin-8 methylmutase
VLDTGLETGNGKKAVLLLGHGSKMAEANDTLRHVAKRLKVEGGYGFVQPAFLQMESPDFQEAFAAMVEQGFNDITIMPYFLYMGAHVQKDLPAEVVTAQAKFPGVKAQVTANLGFHDKLVDIVIERIGAEVGGPSASGPSTGGPSTGGPSASGPSVGESTATAHPIEVESMRIIDERLGSTDALGFTASELAVVKRVIHTTADFDFKEIMRFSSWAVKAGISALRAGCNIITDVKMVRSGIPVRRLKPFGAELFCFSSDPEVIRAAERQGITRTAASMRRAAPLMNSAIVVVGNAPTALRELMALIKKGEAAPALVVGVPVGFVGAAEAKEALAASGIEYITSVGNKGGSTVAAAIVNAIAIEAAS